MAVLMVVAVQLLGIFVSNAKCLQQVRDLIANLKFENVKIYMTWFKKVSAAFQVFYVNSR